MVRRGQRTTNYRPNNRRKGGGLREREKEGDNEGWKKKAKEQKGIMNYNEYK